MAKPQAEEDSARPVILEEGETDEDAEQSSFLLHHDESGLVSIAALEIAGEQLVKEGRLVLNHLQEQWLFEWKSWKNDAEELLWLHLIDGKKLVEQQGFYLPRMGIPLQADGAYKIDVRILYDQKVLAEQSLHLQLKEQYYGGEGSGGMLTLNGRAQAAKLFAFDPLQAKVAFSESDNHGNFYFKYKYRGNYKIFAFNDSHYSLSETSFQSLQGGATIYHALELDNPLTDIEQAWLLASGSNEVEAVQDGVKEVFQFAEESLNQPLLAGVISENGRLSWQYFSRIGESIELNIDRLVYQDRRALLFVLQPHKIPFTRWLHTNATAAKSRNEEGTAALLDDTSLINTKIIHIAADMVKSPQISAQNIGAVTANSQLLLSSITGQDITNWRWFINGEYLGDDLSAIYDVPADYDRDIIQIRLIMQDKRGNSFEREYQIEVRDSGIIWSADSAAPYWVKDWGKPEQEFFFEVNFVDENIDFDQENQLFHWYLEESNTVATVPDLTAKANVPFKTKFEQGGVYRLRLETATENGEGSMSYENDFIVNTPPTGLQITGTSQVSAGDQVSFSATLDSLASQLSEGDELSYSWFIDDQPIDNFPQISLNADATVLTFQSDTLAVRDKTYTLKLQVNDGFYPRSAVVEHTFEEKALPLSLQIENTLATAAANYDYLEGAEQSFRAVFINNSNANIDTALFNYSWFLDRQDNGQYTELDTNNAPLDKWESNADQLNLILTNAAHYRLRLVIDYDDGNEQQTFEDELLFRVNAPLDALTLNSNKNELEAGETLLLEADLANFAAQEQDGDTLSYRWRYWQDGNFDDAQVIELQAASLPAGFVLNEGQLEFTVDAALAADTEWKFQVGMNDGVYADWLWSASKVVQLKQSVWTLALTTDNTAPYLVNVPLDFTTQVADLPLGISEEQLSYQWQLEIMDNLNYRDAISNGSSAEATLNLQDSSASLLFLSGGQYRFTCRASYSGQNNSSQRQQMLTFKVNTPPGTLELTADKSSIDAGELLDLNALLDNLAAQQADGDVLSYTWQEEINSQFVDLDPMQLAGEFSLNNEQNILSYQSSIALANKLERTFRVKVEDGVYPQGIFSNTLTIEVQPAASSLKIVHISDNDPNYVFVYGNLEEFGVIPEDLPAGLSSAALSYQWSLQIRDQQGDYVAATLQHADILSSNLAQYSPTFAVDADFRIVLEGVYSDDQGQTRTLNTQRDVSVNREIDAVTIQSSAATAEAGSTLSFEALIGNQSEQQGDTLSYLWQEEAADGSLNDISAGNGWQLNGKELSFTVPLELASKETKKIRVLVADAHYAAVSSAVTTFEISPLNLTLSIESKETVLKVNQSLEFSADFNGLNNLLNKNAFSYSWELQARAADGSLSDASNDFSAANNSSENFEPTFSRSGDYRLTLTARYGVNTPRVLNASLDIHLNHLPATATIESSAVSQSINAGDSVNLSALLSNLQAQLDEGDTVSYRWQQRNQAASQFSDLDAQNLTASITENDNQLQIEVPASLNKQEAWEFRVIVSDSQGQESTSTAHSLTFEIAPVQLSIVTPQNTLLVDRGYTFNTKIEDLPSSVGYADLRYAWSLQKEQADGTFQATDASQATIDNSSSSTSNFLVEFKEGGDYRLTLEVRYGSQPERILTENAIVHINHPPKQLDLVFDPLISELKAGSAVEIVANFAEQQHLDEGDSLTWSWMFSRNSGAFVILEANKLPSGFSFVNERRVRYSVASTLPADETVEFRVLINDSVYPVLSSQKSLDVKAARLTPLISLANTPYKINEPLSIGARVPAEQLPNGVTAADLSYLWKVQQQNNGSWQETSSGFLSSGETTDNFQPTFSNSGDYRLHVRVSFGSNGQSRSFVTTQDIHLNHQPNTPTLSRTPSAGDIQAGDSVQLQATLNNLAAQVAENDSLNWIWQMQQGANAWQDIDKSNPLAEITFSNAFKTLTYKVAATLASDEQRRFRVKLNDGVYSDTAYSNELDADLKAAQLTPVITLSTAPYKIDEALSISGSVPAAQLPTGVAAADLSYLWKVQQQNSGSWQDTSNGFRARSNNNSSFEPTFSSGGDYRLHLSVSFGSGANTRTFTSTQDVHLNHRPSTPLLRRSPATGDIEAGDSVSLEAAISDLDRQTAEGDTLSWSWQMKQGSSAWSDIDNNNLPAEMSLSNANRILSYTPLNTLASDEQRSFRIKVSDGVYSSSSNSQMLSIDFKAAQLNPAITLPTAPYKINEQLSISGSVPASQLPTGVAAADLSYSWTVQQQNSGSWQDSKSGFNAASSNSSNFQPTFSSSGDYRLLLSVSFGSGSQIRTFNTTQDLHLNHQPSTPTLSRTPTTADIQAGDAVTLQASIDNLAAQAAENDTLSWSWQMKQGSGAWSDIDNSSLPAEITLSDANRTLNYTPPNTLASDEQRSFRVKLNDGVYNDTAYSNQLDIDFKAAQLTPTINLPTAPYKINEQLSISGSVPANQLPTGVTAADLSYLWKVQQQNNSRWQDTSSGFNASGETTDNFQPTFTSSGDYRLQLSVSFGSAPNIRSFSTSQVLHLNHQPSIPTLTRLPATGEIEAGDSLSLEATISSLDLQTAEGDTLSWNWQMKQGSSAWSDIDNNNLPAEITLSNANRNLAYTPLNTLASDEQRSFRVRLNDGVYSNTAYSAELDIAFKAAVLTPAISLPAAPYKINEQLSISGSVPASQLPTGIAAADLSYLWQVQEQNNGNWQNVSSGLSASTNNSSTFAPTFSKSGDYRLQLSVSFGSAASSRTFVSRQDIHLDHPPFNLTLARTPANGDIQAGEQIELKANLANLQAQNSEGNNLTWQWEEEQNGSWRVLQSRDLPAGSTINNDTLVYKVPATVNNDGSKVLRIRVNDGVYRQSLSSSALSFDYKQVQLTPSITLPTAPYKVNEELSISGSVPLAQLPSGVTAADLSYAWQVLQQSSGSWQETNSGFSANSSNTSSFQPTFSSSGDYRLQLSVSFSSAGSSRSFVSTQDIHLNYQPLTPTLTRSPATGDIQAGDSVQLQATTSNLAAQTAENDTLSWSWQMKQGSTAWSDIDNSSPAAGVTLSNGYRTLQYTAPSFLANDEQRRFRVKLNDGVYSDTAYSSALDIDFKAAQLTPVINLPAAPYKINEALSISGNVPASQLPSGITAANLSYAWKVQQQNNGNWQDSNSGFRASSSNASSFQPTFSNSGDYRLHLSVSFGSAGNSRSFVSTQDIHLNYQPLTPTLTRNPTVGDIQAGDSVELQAATGNLAAQTSEGDTLSWGWQMKQGSAAWQDIDNSQPSPNVTLSNNNSTLNYTAPNTLASDEQRSFRVKLNDGVYSDTAYSSSLDIAFKAVVLTPSITLPTAPYKINEQLSIRASVPASQLPTGVTAADLSYAWQVQQQNNGNWQNINNGFSVSNSNSSSFQPTFTSSGDYRLQLSVSFGSGNNTRTFSTSQALHLNYQPTTPTVVRTPIAGDIQAGDSVTLQATVSNLAAQVAENDTLSWSWQIKQGSAAWQDINNNSPPSSMTLSNANRTLNYTPPTTLASDGQRSFRVKLNDGVYSDTAYSSALDIAIKAAQLTPTLNLPTAPYKINDALSISGSVPASQLPSGISAADLSYAWKVQQQNNGSWQDTSSGFSASSNNSSSFQPTFSNSGDYRLHLSVSFGSGGNLRTFTSTQVLHLNYQPTTPTLSRRPTAGDIQAGDSLQLQATIGNLAAQSAENDTLSWSWQMKQGSAAWLDIDNSNPATGISLSNSNRTLQYTAPSTLASDEQRRFRVKMNDGVYSDTAYSNALSIDFKAVQLNPSINLPTAPYRINERLSISASVPASQLPTGVTAAALRYVWKVQQQNNGSWQDTNSGFNASSNNTSNFQPSFSNSGDYRLQVSVSFGSNAKSRTFVSRQDIHLDHPPLNLTLARTPANGDIQAGGQIELKATLANLPAQSAEGNNLTWQWEEQNNGSWVVLQSRTLPTGSSINGATLIYRVPATVNNDRSKVFRIRVNDGVYRQSLSSSAVSFDYKQAQLTPSITLPTAPYKINEQLNISSSLPANQLPQGVSAADLSYVWKVQQQSSGSWQDMNSGFSVSNANSSSFQPTFTNSGDYRLHLSVSFGSGASVRTFSSTQALHLNHQPNTPTLARTPTADIQAGDSVQLQATIGNLAAQSAENDTLSWSWQMKQGSTAWSDIDNNSPATGVTLSNGDRTLQYTALSTLANDEQRSFRVKLNDGVYSDTAYSSPLAIDFKAALLTPVINLPTAPYKINEALSISGSVPASQLPSGVTAAALRYAWKVQQQNNGSWQDTSSGYRASSANSSSFQPTFSNSGDYRLHLSVSFGSAGNSRTFVSRQALHLNHQPSTPTLARTPTAADIQAGDAVTLQATISNLAAQTSESDTLSWSWQMQQGSAAWQNINNNSPPPTITLSNAHRTLSYRAPNTLASDEQRRFRVKLNDGVYSDTAYSSSLDIAFKAALLTPAISLPTAPHKLNEQLNISGSVPASQLPNGVAVADLSYAWKVQQQSNGNWQDTSSGFSASSANSSSFQPTFSNSGDYRLHLSVSFGNGGKSRTFVSTQPLHLNHQPLTPTLARTPTAGDIQAGDSVQLQATISNLAAQSGENDTLSWSWQMQQGSAAWQDINNNRPPSSITLSNANRSLRYTAANTLASDEQRRFRVKMNDGVYSDTAYSSALAISFKAALLTPAINLPTAPYKINEQLSIGGSVPASQLPRGISAAALSYAWKVQQQNNGSWQDTSSGYRASSANSSSFQPTFSNSGDYRLHLSVSFGSAGNSRTFVSTQVVHLNYQPTTPTLSRTPTAGDIQAGDAVTLQATIGNLAAQTTENDTLSWSWQMKRGSTAWQEINNNSPPSSITLSNANRSLRYSSPSTLASDEQRRFRVKMNDGVYSDTAYSSVLNIDFKAIQLTPAINLPAAPHKISEQLSISGSVPASQLPSGITAANLSYVWKVQRQNNGNWQDTSSGYRASSRNSSSFQPTFSNSGDYRLHLSVSFGSGNNSRTFITTQALHINHQPGTLTLTPNPATGNINGGQTIALRAALSNLAQQTAENDSITWTWQRAIIDSNATLQESDFRLIPGTTVNQNYAVPITHNREQKLYFRLTLSDGVYASKTLTSNAVTLTPLSISVNIVTPQQATPNLKYKSNSPYTFSASLTPPLNNVRLNYVWSLERNNAQLSSSQQPTPSLNFSNSGEHQLKLKLSYSSGGSTRALSEVSSTITVNTPPQNISLSAQKRAANSQLTTLDLSAATAHNISTNEQLILTPLVANAALQNREGDTLSYRWRLKTAANAASLPASSTTVNARGYSQDNSTGVLTIDAQILRTNNSNRYQRFLLQVRDDVYNQWIDSSEFSFTFDRDPDQLQLKKSTALVSSDRSQPSHIQTLERTNYTVEFYDPDNRIVNLRVRANNGTQGLRLETPSALSTANAQGKRQSSFHLTANRLSNVNINLRVRATGNGNLLRQNFFLQRQNVAPSAIRLSALGNAVSRQASSQTTLAARQTHNLRISFRDPNHQVANNWKIERVQNTTLTHLSQAASQGIGYTLVGQGTNNVQTGERSNISFNLRLDAPLRQQETIQLRISLSSDAAASYTLSQDFYLVRNSITPSNLRFFRRMNNVDYEIDPQESIDFPARTHERIFARIDDPDRQVSRLENIQRPHWLLVSPTQSFGAPINAQGHRQTSLFMLRAFSAGANGNIQFSLRGTTAQSLLPANNSYSLAVASVGNVAPLRLFAHKNTDRTGAADEEELSRDANAPSQFPAGAVIALRPQQHYDFPHQYRFTTNQTGLTFLHNNNMHQPALNNQGKTRLLRGDERYNLRYILDKRLGYQNRRSFTVSLFHHNGALLARSTYYLQVPRLNWTVNYRFDSPILQSSRVHALDGWDDYVLMATNKGLIRTRFDERDGRLALQAPQTYQSNSNVHKVDVYNNKAYSVRDAGASARLDISRLSNNGNLSVENSLSFSDIGISSSGGMQPIFAKQLRAHNRDFLIFGYKGNQKTWLNLYRFNSSGALNRTLLSSLSLPGNADELTPIEGTAFFTMISWGAASANAIRSFAIDNNSGIYSLRIIATYNKDNSAGIREPSTTLQYVHISPDRSKIALATWLGISYGSINANGELNIASVNTNFGHLIKRIYYNDGLYLVQNYQHHGASHLYWARLNMDNNSFTAVEDYREGQFNISGGFNTSLYHSQRRYVLKAWENDLVRFGDEQDHGVILAYRAPGS